jgi:hypothetical protein
MDCKAAAGWLGLTRELQAGRAAQTRPTHSDSTIQLDASDKAVGSD